MWRWRRYLAKFCNLFRHNRAEAELAREVASHLALLEDDFLRRGMTSQEARLAARRAYGGIEQVKDSIETSGLSYGLKKPSATFARHAGTSP